MQLIKIFKNESGISLVQVMVSLSILAAAQLGIMRMSQNQNKSAKTVEIKYDSAELINNIRTILTSNKACRNTFGSTGATAPYTGSINANTGNISSIKNSNSNDVFTEGAMIASTPIKITNFRLDSTTLPAATIAPNSTGQTHLKVTLNRTENIYGAGIIEKRILINARVDGAGNILDCSAASVSDSMPTIAKYVCESLGGNWEQAGRAGAGDCQDVNLNGSLTLSRKSQYDASWLPANYNDGKGVEIGGTSLLNGDVTMGSSTTSNILIRGATQVQGNLTIDPGFYIDMLSDQRLKYDIEDLGDPNLVKLNQIKTASYKWLSNDKKDIGFIAQNIRELYPELVTRKKDGYFSVKYNQMIPVSINAIQNLSKKFIKQEKEIIKLKKDKLYNEKKLKALERRLNALEKVGEKNG